MKRKDAEKVREMLRRYQELKKCRDPYAAAWVEAIDAALAHYDRTGNWRGRLLRRRYIDRPRVGIEDMPEELHIGRNTYYQGDADALSTVAVEAAVRGVLR